MSQERPWRGLHSEELLAGLDYLSNRCTSAASPVPTAILAATTLIALHNHHLRSMTLPRWE